MKRTVGKWKALWALLWSLCLAAGIFLTGCSDAIGNGWPEVFSNGENSYKELGNQELGNQESTETSGISKDGVYTSKEEVALYLHTYGGLPSNFITKKEAQKLGWDNKKGNLWEVADGKSIGGDRFGNYEGLLPEADGRSYKECDIGYQGGFREAKRLVYSNDGLIFYTEDHYQTFEQLY